MGKIESIQAPKTQKRVLAYCDFDAKTGFSRIAEDIITTLAKDEEINFHFDVISLNYHGSTAPTLYRQNIYGDKIRLIPVLVSSQQTKVKDFYGRHVYLKYLQNHYYDLTFILHNLITFRDVVPFMKAIKKGRKQQGRKFPTSIAYFPVDNALTPEEVEVMRFYDYPVCYSQFAMDQIKTIMGAFKDKRFLKNISQIPHSIDPNKFYPASDKERRKYRREIFKDHIKEDDILIVQVNRNSLRKNIPASLIAFHRFRQKYYSRKYPKNKGEVKYYIHCDPTDKAGIHLIRFVLNNMPDLVPHILFPSSIEESIQSDDGLLRKIYTSADLFITCSHGEGWGLTTVEAMQSGVPIVAPNNSTFAELSQNGKLFHLVNPKMPITLHWDDGSRIRWAVDPLEFGDEMLEYCMNGNATATKKAKEFSDQFHLDKISVQWKNLFKKALTN